MCRDKRLLLRLRAGFVCAGLTGCLLLASERAWAKGAEKPVTLSLPELGQQGFGGRPQVAGSTQATVHFVGDHHLLVTFPVRRLMKRLAECEPDDEDRTIDAVLVDVASGKVAARTSWRMHDNGQYLWDLGQGRFLLRLRDRLVVVAPLDNLETEQPFSEHALLEYARKVVGILVSAEGDLLTVETRERVPAPEGSPAIKAPEGLVNIEFYRLEEDGGTVRVVSAGRVVSRTAIEVPMTRDGYLDTAEEARGRWVFDYIGHAGKKTELSPFDTSCAPVAKFVSRSEFVAFGCRGSEERMEIGGFDMRGEQMWQQNLFESFIHPTFSFAPDAGRFALGRSIVTPGSVGEANGAQLTGQDVVVMQAHSGKQIFHTVVTPVQRAGQNFALAPDGMKVAVVRGATVEIHRLPELSARDKQDVKMAKDVALERSAGPILLPTRSRSTVAANAAMKATGQEESVPVRGVSMGASSGESAGPDQSGTSGGAVVARTHTPGAKVAPATGDDAGNSPGETPRKAPTLYGEGEAGPHP